jgi:molybdate transport system substrate-binding protein
VFAAIALCMGASAAAEEIVVFSTPSLKPVLSQLVPDFEKSTQHKLTIRFGSVAALKREIDGGAPFDVALLLPPQIDDLIAEGKAIRSSRADLAVALTGVAVREGFPRFDVSSPDAVRQSLLLANSAAYASDSASGQHFLSVIDRLGIGAQMQPKLRKVSGNPVEAVAHGEADLTIITVPNIISTPEVKFAGVLPSQLQNITTYTAALSAAAEKSASANALLQYLNSPDGSPAFIANGLQRPAR